MKSEQLFEIDRQINQIRKVFEQRQEKTNQFNLPLKRILAPCRTPQEYLQKKYSHSHLKHYKHSTEGKIEDAEKMLKDHLQQAKQKVKKHHNELKQLDGLIKKRNMIRLLKMQEKKNQKENKKPINLLQEPSSPKKEVKTIHDGQKVLPKMEKKHSISDLKGQKLLQAFQQVKSRGIVHEEACGLLKRQLGMGIENTPIQSWIDKRNNEQNFLAKSKSSKKVFRVQKPKTSNFFRTMQYDVDMDILRPAQKNRYTQIVHQTIVQVLVPLQIDFQKRLINIMKYHGKNVGIEQ